MATHHQLAQLIDGVKAANRWSDPKLVTNAEEQGHVLSKSNISRYRNPLVSIKGEIILALAAGLRVAPSQVAIAAIESMGIALPQYDILTPEQAVQLDTTLSARDRDAVLALLKNLRSTAQSPTSPEAEQAQEVSGAAAKREWLEQTVGRHRPSYGSSASTDEPESGAVITSAAARAAERVRPKQAKHGGNERR